MPSYDQLGQEQVWHDQFVPPFMSGFLITPLQNFYGLDANNCNAPGDNNHLYGRHRSANWDLQSAYCTNRSYGTKDARDKQGNLNWYRAVDIGIQGQTLWDACHRMDAAVRAGEIPELAEWFGTFDGQTVVGWYEGHASSSDSSHLYHMHLGVWNEFADNFQVMEKLFAIVTGEDMGLTQEEHTWLYNTANLTYEALVLGHDTMGAGLFLSGSGTPTNNLPIELVRKVNKLQADNEDMKAQLETMQAAIDALQPGGSATLVPHTHNVSVTVSGSGSGSSGPANASE